MIDYRNTTNLPEQAITQLIATYEAWIDGYIVHNKIAYVEISIVVYDNLQLVNPMLVLFTTFVTDKGFGPYKDHFSIPVIE